MSMGRLFFVFLLAHVSLHAFDSIVTVSGEAGYTGSLSGQFDLYLLQLSWWPVFCCEQVHEGYCQAPQHSNRLVLHGLWPEYNHGVTPPGAAHQAFWPQYCIRNNTAADNSEDFAQCFRRRSPTKFHTDDLEAQPYCHLDRTIAVPPSSELEHDLREMAPGYMEHTMGDHEWIKHGSCSGLSAKEYLQQAVETTKRFLAQSLVSFLKDHASQSIAASDLLSLIPDALISVSSDNNRTQLTHISTCWERLEDNRVGERIPCPDVTQELFEEETKLGLLVFIPSAAETEPRTCFAKASNNETHSFAFVSWWCFLAGVLLLGWVVLWFHRTRRNQRFAQHSQLPTRETGADTTEVS